MARMFFPVVIVNAIGQLKILRGHRDDRPCGLFGGTACTPKVSVSSFRKKVPLYGSSSGTQQQN
jgi:hypothetical protein